MICPEKKCRIEIEDDSIFCDQCGSQILICSKCGMPGTGKFCAKDGGLMVTRKKVIPVAEILTPEEKPVNLQEMHAPAPQGEVRDKPMPTARPDNNMNPVIKELLIVHSSGYEMKIKDNDILGRNDGPHSEYLGKYNFISRSHAMIFSRSGGWYIKDKGSTNKSKVNEIILEPEKEYSIKKNDRIMLADQEFTVK